MKLVIFSQPILFRIDTNIAFQNVGNLFVYAYRVQEDERMEQIQRLRTEKDQIFQPVKKDTDNLQTVVSAVEESGDVMHLSQNVVETFIDRIANALMEQEVAVCMTNFARIMNELNNAFAGRNEVVDRLCGYPLLVIDDFGMERGTEYALEQIYNIIDSRYRSGKPLIVTTNLTLTELKNPQDTAHARIYDRLLELCAPIACTGPSMRKNIGQAKLDLLKTLLA